MGGKKYPKKGSSSEGSGQSQETPARPASGGQPQQGPGDLRQRVQQMSLQDAGPSGQQPQSRQAPSQQPQQNQPAQTQGRGRGQPRQQQPQPQQQQQGKGRGRGQPTQQQQHPQQQQQQQQPRPQQQQQQQRSDGGQKQLPRAESSQSIHSEKSQHSAASSASRKTPAKADDKSLPSAPGLIVQYKGPGKNGRKLGDIETNYLRIIIDKLVPNAYHYDVTIEPDRPKKYMTMVFLEFKRINFPNASIAFDGAKSAYACQRLKIGDMQREIKIVHPETGKERPFLVSIQEAHDTEIPIKKALTSYQGTRQAEDPKRAMQALEVILKSAFHQPHLRNGIQGGRSFFLPPTRREYLGDSYELWLGLFQSLVLGSMPLLNVDVNHKAFPKRYNSLIDLFRDMENDMRTRIDLQRPLDRHVEETLKRHLSGLELCYTNPGTQDKRVYKFMSIDRPPRDVTFKLENGQQTNVLEYFQKSGRRIQYPALPCIKLGNNIKNQSVPMEFCSIPDTQVVNKKCTENQTRNIIRFAATSTDVRKDKIMDLLNQIRHNQSSIIKGFGLSVGTDFTKAPARLLDAPNIQYGNKMITPSRGVWRGENMLFLRPESGKVQWAILNTHNRTSQRDLEEFGNNLSRCCGATGLQLEQKPAFIKSVNDRNSNDIERELKNVGQNALIRILFCVIPDSGPTYSKIKQMAEIDYGVLTQCIKGGTIFRKRSDGSTLSNILLKVNAKLNGTNHKLQSTPIITKSRCMIIGADVTHPSPEQNRIPSVVGVAASHDQHAFCYNICWRLQGQRKEMIEDFETIMKEHLEFFKKKNGFLPDKILYYRDGVSEGQFDQIMAIERNAMMRACQQISPGYGKQVKMTIVVVQKRHHTRFFPGQTGIGRDDRKNNNVPAGTIVDTVITRPNENHFYLVSHQSIQGVAKPTKYCILLDEGEHSIDDLQGLTYNLCHLFTRCNRAVSYPAPTYYAHLAAYRGRVYIENQNLNMDNLQREWANRAIKNNIIKGHPMYFV